MASDYSSIRMARLNKLMHLLLSRWEVPREELLCYIGYSSARTLQRDLSYLRTENSVQVSYNFSKHTYKCSDPGNFVLCFKLSADEGTALIAGIDMTELFLPEISSNVRSLWNKIQIFVPHTDERSGKKGWPAPDLLLPRDLADRYLRIAEMSKQIVKGDDGDGCAADHRK